jgi:threonine synthase
MEYDMQICNKCNGLLEVFYTEKTKIPKTIQSFWDYEKSLPKGKYRHFELGNTKMLRDSNVFFKLEIWNPTKSFKDRGSVVEVAKAFEYNFKELVCASTGNMAYSIAYYAKLYGIHAKIFISDNANKDKIRYIRETHDANVEKVNGDFTKAQKLAIEYSKKTGAFLAGDYCYRKEGQKTVGYELGGEFTHVIIPIGNATLFSAVYKAFIEMKEAKQISKIPKLIGVESEGAAPIARALANKDKITYSKPKTKADAIAVGFPTYGTDAIEAIKKTNGAVVAVSDNKLLTSQKQFYTKYGLIVELGGIAGYAATDKLKFKDGDKIAVVITGGNV